MKRQNVYYIIIRLIFDATNTEAGRLIVAIAVDMSAIVVEEPDPDTGTIDLLTTPPITVEANMKECAKVEVAAATRKCRETAFIVCGEGIANCTII
jgi:hypothetical protein